MNNNLLGAYTLNGNFDSELYYVTLFDKIPCVYQFEIDKSIQLDPNKIEIKYIADLFTDVTSVRVYNLYELEDTTKNKEETDQEFISIFDENEIGKSLVMVADNIVLRISCSTIRVYYDFSEHSHDYIIDLVNKIYEKIPKDVPEKKNAKVGLIKVSNGEYYTAFSNIEKTTIDIDENYNDDFLPVHKDVVDFLNQRKSGLILLYGNMGTGNFYKNNLHF